MRQILLSAFNPLPNDKILALSKLEAFADSISNVAQMVQSFLISVENIVGKGEMLITSISFFSHNVFKSFFSPLSLIKSWHCAVKGEIPKKKKRECIEFPSDDFLSAICYSLSRSSKVSFTVT